MWYIAWVLGTLLACSVSIITALGIEHIDEETKTMKQIANGDF